ncbi:MAG: hypothetical protein V2I43_00065 [Parvularcula sp.]|jgi:hypothetical protein|nr:hypothetical protein [Parvularcula sp.]
MNEVIALPAALLTTSLVAVLHYIGLQLISRRMVPAMRDLGKRRLPVVIVSLVPIHLAGIAVFAGVMLLLIEGGFGDLAGREVTFGALLYFSGVSYTSLGFW